MILCIIGFAEACSEHVPGAETAFRPGVVSPLTIDAKMVILDGDPGDFSVKKSVRSSSEGVQFITWTFQSDLPSELMPASIKFQFPSVDIYGYWNPKISVDKVNFYNTHVSAKASRYAPILSYYNNALTNRITMSLSDALNRSDIFCYLKEEDVHFHPEIKLFQEKLPLTTHYSITLRIDTRQLPYYKVIDDVASWWADDCGYTPLHVPEGTKRPMYSTWYSYHQNMTAEEIVTECKIAKSLGCEAVIIDDGWQTLDANRGYAYTGDWIPERIPEMKTFVEDVHNTGMKFILWYSLPFVGEKAVNFPRFRGKYLRHWESQGTWVLDPRYPEVREFISNTYVKALQDWGLDGFKLDFIGRFTADENTLLTQANGRDFASVNEATDTLMTQVTRKLRAINPDILIEFRQPYIGPVMRKYGNMFRGVDAPNNAVANRIETTNLRIMSQNTAVHSDMFIWRKEEPVEKAALQILNILYSVPQLSVRLAEVPELHRKMIRFWFDFWNTNRDILVNGEFVPSDPVGNYPVLTARKDRQQVTTLYEDMVVEVPTISDLDLVNAKADDSIIIRLEQPFDGEMVVKDCTGKIWVQRSVHYPKGVSSLWVPPSGLIQLTQDK